MALTFGAFTWLSLGEGIEDDTLVTAGVDLNAGDTVAGILAVAQWLLCIPHLVVGFMVLRRVPSAFGAATFILAAYGVVALLLAGGPALAGNPGPNAVWGIAAGVANLAVVGLLVHPATRRDLDAAQMRRDWLTSRGSR